MLCGRNRWFKHVLISKKGCWMSEQTLNNKTLVIGLVVVAVLLAAIVGVLWYQQAQALPEPVATTAPATEAAPVAGAPAGMPSGSPGTEAAPTEVDPETATKVPEGTEPEAFVQAYYEACDAGDWQAAFDALPVDKQANNSPEALAEQVTGYGIEGFSIVDSTTQGDTAVIKVDQVTGQYGTFENTWTFVQKDGQWFVVSKAVTGMK
jgi:hypothetical protein